MTPTLVSVIGISPTKIEPIDTLTSELTDIGIARNTSEFKQKIQQKREQKS